MELSDRLQAIADLVGRNSIVADIGTDHGYIPIYLIENSISKKVIAADISRGSLDKAVENIDDAGLEDRISTRLGNGLDVIREFEVDTVIIAGMGGILIRDILDENLKKTNSISNLILQPNIAADELRRYLVDNSYEIVDERLVRDGKKYYEIIHARKGIRDIKEDRFYQVGDRLIENKDPLLRDFIEHRMDLNTSILKTLEKSNGESIKERMEFIEAENSKYQEVLDKIEG